jgi:hypothetical protein
MTLSRPLLRRPLQRIAMQPGFVVARGWVWAKRWRGESAARESTGRSV